MRAGAALIVTAPLAAVTVTGNAAAAASPTGQPEPAGADVEGAADVLLLPDEPQPASATAATSGGREGRGGPGAGAGPRRGFHLGPLPPGNAGRKARPPVTGSDARGGRDGSPFPRGSISSGTSGVDLARTPRAGSSQLRDSAGMAR